MNISQRYFTNILAFVSIILFVNEYAYSNWGLCDGFMNYYITSISDTSVERAVGLTYASANKDTIYQSELKNNLLSIYNSYNYVFAVTFFKDSALRYYGMYDTLGIYWAKIDKAIKGNSTKDTLIIYNSSSNNGSNCHPDVSTIGRRASYLIYFNDIDIQLKLVEIGFSFGVPGRPVCYTIRNDTIIPMDIENTFYGLSIDLLSVFGNVSIHKNTIANARLFNENSVYQYYTLLGRKYSIFVNSKKELNNLKLKRIK